MSIKRTSVVVGVNEWRVYIWCYCHGTLFSRLYVFTPRQDIITYHLLDQINEFYSLWQKKIDVSADRGLFEHVDSGFLRHWQYNLCIIRLDIEMSIKKFKQSVERSSAKKEVWI